MTKSDECESECYCMNENYGALFLGKGSSEDSWCQGCQQVGNTPNLDQE